MTKRLRRPVIIAGSLVLVATGLGLSFALVFSAAPDLPPIPVIEITTADPAVQTQARAARQAVEAGPRDPLANGRLGVLYELYLYPDAARVCFERASLLAPREFRWLYYLGRSQRALGDPGAAILTLGRALEINREYTPAITQLGQAYLENRRVAKAEETFGTALRYDPNSCSARLGLGKCLAIRGEHAAAIEQYELGLERAPRHAPLHYALGLSYRAVGETERAQEHMDIAQQGGPANPDPDPLVAELYAQEVGADSDYRKAKRLLNDRRYQEGIALLRTVLDGDPDHFGAHGALGKALMLTGQQAEALAAYEKAVALNPTNLDFLRSSALLLYRARRYEEAQARLGKVLEFGGDHPDDHHVRGAALVKLRRADEAIREFELALQRNPDHQEARRGFVQMLKVKAHLAVTDAEAVRFLRRAVEAQPRDAEALTLLGGRLTNLGDLAGALAAYEQALTVDPNLAEALMRRDELKARIGGSEGG